MPEIVEKMTRIGNTAVHAAQEENRRKGIPNVYVLNGTIVWQLPDGSVTTKRPDALLAPTPNDDATRLGTWFSAPMIHENLVRI
jgi:hypothetical protein